MSINRNANQRKRTEQDVWNAAYDEDFDVPAFELLSFDPIADALKRVTTNALGEYVVNDTTDTTQTVYYVGREDPDGDWYIQKVDQTSGNSIRFATHTNNSGYSSYSTAWTDRTSLTYGTYSEAF